MQKFIDRWCCNSSLKCLFTASIELHWNKILYSSQIYYIGHTDILCYEKMHWLNFISKLSDLLLLIYNTLTCHTGLLLWSSFWSWFQHGPWRPPKECTYECSQPSLLLLCRNQFLTGQTGFINAKTSFTSLKLVLPVRHQQTYSKSISGLVGAWNEHHSKTSF